MKGNIDRIHQIYMYPARFKPEIPRQVLKMINTHNDLPVLDPFAGSGTLAIEAYIQGIDSISYDLNPIIEVLIDAKIKILEKKCRIDNVRRHLETMKNWTKKKHIDETVQKWYPPQALDYLSRIWKYAEENIITFNHKSRKFEFIDEKCGGVTSIIILYATRKISYTDNSIYKYYRSKHKKNWLADKLRKHKDIVKLAEHLTTKKLKQIAMLLRQTSTYYTGKAALEAKGYIDLLEETNLPRKEIAAIITSPPYLIAHEYIRSFKYDLYWLGLTLEEIRDLSRREIPYRNAPNVKINSPTYSTYRELVREKKSHLVETYDNYFNSIITIFDRLTNKLVENGILAFFVGSPMLAGLRIPINTILREHYISKGYRLEKEREDPIRKRRLFRGRNNDNPNGIESEYLVILRKTR